MPIIQSAKKALRQSLRRRDRNLKRKKEFKAVLKQYKKLVAENKKQEAEKYLAQVYKKLDKSAKRHLIHKNKAARLKSKLSQLL